MSFWSKLFGGGSSGPAQQVEPEIYEGFRIVAEPVSDGGKFRLEARIEKEIDGDMRVHHMIRADTFESAEAAASAASAKARILVDQQGDAIFDAQRG